MLFLPLYRVSGCATALSVSHVLDLMEVKRRHRYYRPQRSWGQGYVFTRVCDSVNRGGMGGLRRTPPGPRRTPPGTKENPPQDQGEPPLGPRRTPPGPGRPPRQEEHCGIR